MNSHESTLRAAIVALRKSLTLSSSAKARRSKSSNYEAIATERLEDRRLLAGAGLQGQYFANQELTDPVVVQVDSTIDFDWGASSPSGVGNDNFSIRWTGQVEPQFTETYSFIVNANDGARLWVNGQLLVDQLTTGTVSEQSGTIDLIAGRKYDIQLEYLEVTGDASVKLEWSSPSLSREVIPAERLYAGERGSIFAQRWNGISGSSINDLTDSPLYPSSPSVVTPLATFESNSEVGENFGQRLNGLLHVTETGPYTFYIAANEQAQLWLSNSTDPAQRELIAYAQVPTEPRDWHVDTFQKSLPAYLVAGQNYYIEALHKEATGADHLAVAWTQPGSASIEVIDGQYLSPIVPEVRVFSDKPTVSEGSTTPAVYTIVRQGAANNLALDVNYSVSGSAINGTDFQALSGVITIPAGADSVDLVLTPIADSILEGEESIVVEIEAGAGYEVGSKSERTVYGKVQDDTDAPAGGDSLWNGQALTDFEGRFGGTFTEETDPVFGDVIQVVITGTPATPFSVQLRQNIDSPVTEGDILWVEFRVKSIGGDGSISAIFEEAGGNYTKSLSQGIPVSTDWSRIQIPFSAVDSYAAGEASFGFHLGYQAQTLQFADFQVLNYGPPKTLAPETGFGLNNISGTHGTSQFINVSDEDFDVAFEVDVFNVPDQVWHLQAVSRNEGVVANGDTMRFEFYVRASAGTDPELSFAVQRTDTYATLYNQSIDLTSEWQFVEVMFDADDDFGINGIQAVFNLGYGIQTVAIGGFQWQNVENNVDIDDLPKQFPSATYEGREATDGWREDADQRIELERKSDVTVNVTDANGEPLEGAVVSLRQTNHEFKFGSAVSAYGGKLDPNGNAQSLKYQSEIKRLFNTVVIENSLKWPGWLNDPARGEQGVNFAVENDLYVRGHNIIWPSRTFMPPSIWAEYDTRVVDDGETAANDWLRTRIETHINDLLTTFDGSIPEWDVVNEPFANNDVMDLLGDGIVLDWFQQVRDFDPNIKLTLNDYGIFSLNGGNTNHRANFEYWLGLLNDAGLLDVIGEQSHYNDSTLTDIDVLGQLIVDYNTQFETPIAITEFDIDSKDEQLQADYLRDYMTMSFSQPGVTEFLHWGFWQSSHWLPDAALYRSDFSAKPNGQAYEDLVFGRWWSDVQGTTRNGEVTANVFRGEYDVLVEYDGQTYNGTVTVDDSGNSSVTINVSADPINYTPVVEVDQSSVSGGVASSLTNTGRWHEPDNQTAMLNASLGSIEKNDDGTWLWTFTPTQTYADQVVTISIIDSAGASSELTFSFSALTNIVSRGTSYGGSAFGESAVATNKTALRPGQAASVANFTNYYRGLNRVLVDVAGLSASSLSASDFEFRVGNTDTPSNWILLDGSGIALPTITVTATTTPGIDQILLAWDNNEIENTWLQVTVKANSNTGLGSDDVFYFGNQIGDVNGDTTSDGKIKVNSIDMIFVSANRTIGSTVGIENLYDVDRNGTVNSIDMIRVSANRVLTGGLLMFTPSSASSFAEIPPLGENENGSIGDEPPGDEPHGDEPIGVNDQTLGWQGSNAVLQPAFAVPSTWDNAEPFAIRSMNERTKVVAARGGSKTWLNGSIKEPLKDTTKGSLTVSRSATMESVETDTQSRSRLIKRDKVFSRLNLIEDFSTI